MKCQSCSRSRYLKKTTFCSIVVIIEDFFGHTCTVWAGRPQAAACSPFWLTSCTFESKRHRNIGNLWLSKFWNFDIILSDCNDFSNWSLLSTECAMEIGKIIKLIGQSYIRFLDFFALKWPLIFTVLVQKCVVVASYIICKLS